MGICFKCSRKFSDEVKFCPDCGENVSKHLEFNCVYECVEKAIKAVKVHYVAAYCNISREKAIYHLQKLKSYGYIGGTGRNGYWLTARTAPQRKIDQQEEETKKIFRYLEEHRDTSLSQIATDTQLSIQKVKKIISHLEKQGKIKLTS